MARSWGQAGLVLVAGAVLAAVGFATGSTGVALVELVLFLGLAILLSPLGFPRSVPAAEASRLATTAGRPIVYWRPGCPYCVWLRLTLFGVARRASWVNIWTDPAGAAAVRAVANGNETVPTVVIAGKPAVNPSPRLVRAQLRAS